MRKLTNHERRTSIEIYKSHIFKCHGKWRVNNQFSFGETPEEKERVDDLVCRLALFVKKLNQKEKGENGTD